MDNSAPVVRFRPDRRITVAAAAGAVVLALLALVADDGPSRLLFGIGVVLLAANAISDVVFSPRVVASADGVELRSPSVRVQLPWSRIEAVRVDTRARLGLRSTTLEVDASEVLAVFSRRTLATEPEEAAALINAFRPPGEWPGDQPRGSET